MQTRRQFVAAAMAARASMAARALMPILIVDGRHNHDWRATTAELKSILEQAGFRVDVATAPPSNDALSSFLPEFARYRVVLPNYTDFGNGGEWGQAAKAAFSEYVTAGGGIVIVHAAPPAPSQPGGSTTRFADSGDGAGVMSVGAPSCATQRAQFRATFPQGRPAITGRSTLSRSRLAHLNTRSSPVCRPGGCTPKTNFSTVCAALPPISNFLPRLGQTPPTVAAAAMSPRSSL